MYFNHIPKPTVRVEYDKHGKRASRPFNNPYLARRFYTAKLKAGKNPAVRKAR